MAAEGSFLVCKSDVAVDPAVHYVAVDGEEVLGGIIFHGEAFYREGFVGDGVDVILG